MAFIEKLLELLSLTKEHWIAILLSVIIAGTIGGWLYISSLQTQIKSLEFVNQGLTFQLQEQRERNESFFEQYKKLHLEQIEQMRKQLEKVEEDTKARIKAEYYRDLYIARLKNSCH